MFVEWLYRTTLEMSLLIGLVLAIRPAVRRALGARAAYWLWFVPVVRAVLIDRPQWPKTLVETVGSPGTELAVAIYPSPDVWTLPASIPWEVLWVAGALAWGAWRAGGALGFRRLLAGRSSPHELPAELSTLIPRRLKRAGPLYFVTDVPGAPFVTGLRRPLVYLPTDFARKFSADERRWIIEHELTHAARGDLWVQFVWELLRGVFWFNPVVHVAASAMREDQELACDQVVLGRSSGSDRYAYGRALLVGGAARVFPSSPFFGNAKRRIAMIGQHRASVLRDAMGLGLCAVIAIFMLTKAPVSVAQVVSDEPMTVDFKDIPIAAVVTLIMRFSGELGVTGLEQLGAMQASIRFQGVPASEALQGVLNCAGFTYSEGGDTVAIVPLPGRLATACDSVGMVTDD